MQLSIPFANLALYLLNTFFPSGVAQYRHARPLSDSMLNFQLRHMHATTSSAHVYFSDVPPELLSVHGLASSPEVPIVTSPVLTSRPPSLHEFTAARHMSKRGQRPMLDWEVDEVLGPDVTRRETLLLLAKMTSNTYFSPEHSDWYDLGDEWDVVRSLLIFFLSLFGMRTLLFMLRG
jgi:lipase ATG15